VSPAPECGIGGGRFGNSGPGESAGAAAGINHRSGSGFLQGMVEFIGWGGPFLKDPGNGRTQR
jgi:hypothetical protein